MRLLTFALSDRVDGRGLAQALICGQARYASVGWLGGARLDRRFAESGDWRMLSLALLQGIPTTRLDSQHIIPRILLPEDHRKSIAVQWVADLPLDVDPFRLAEELDAQLRSLVPSAGRLPFES